jgi:predicted nucleic acid-binding protein
MSAEVSFDTNIFIYTLAGGRDESAGTPRQQALAKSDNAKAVLAQSIVLEPSIISVQLLNEFANVARRKLNMRFEEFGPLLDILASVHTVKPMDLASTRLALEVAGETGYSIYDSNIVAVALLAGCKTLYTEDMQHGRVLFDTLRIINPFHAIR